MKQCRKCVSVKPFDMYYKKKDSKDGFFNICIDCKRIQDRKYKSKYNKKYREKNSEKLKEYNKKYEADNKDKRKKYYKDNRIKINERQKLYIRKRESNDILFKMKRRMRNRILNAFKKSGFGKGDKTVNILGCSFKELKIHLESKFQNWMSWDNYGLYNGELEYGWDIDHIIPVSIAKNENDLIKLNHFTNLQPLCSKINRKIKRDNY
jgi:hypothetical protein